MSARHIAKAAIGCMWCTAGFAVRPDKTSYGIWFLPLQVPEDTRRLHEVDGEMSVVPGQKKMPRREMTNDDYHRCQSSCCGGGAVVEGWVVPPMQALLLAVCARSLCACRCGSPCPAACWP